jgi:choline monooxygenase
MVTLVETLPAEWYVRPEYFEVEKSAVFRDSWIHVAYSEQCEAAGSYVAENLAGFPIFVRRSDDGVLRAFHNVCPHRAGPIVWDGAGTSPNMVCRYHGWAFGQEGELLNPRDFGAELPCSMDLIPVRVAEWRGFVFVCLSNDTAPLVEWLAEFPSAVEHIPVENYRLHTRSVRRVRCNWKTYADNFLEGYHVPTVHPGMTRDADANNYVVHIGDDIRWNIHTMPPRGDSVFGEFGYFWPNFAFNTLPSGIAIERWLPRGHDYIDLYFEYFFAPDTPGVDRMLEMNEQVAQEDVRVCEHVQRNLESGMYSTGFLSPKWEEPLAVFHRLVRQAHAK